MPTSRRPIPEPGRDTPVQIRLDDLKGEAVIAFLRRHHEEMLRITPPGSAHVLDLEALRVPEVTFWSAWHDADLLGCGALKELDARTGEIKSMRTASAHRGHGVASQILQHMVAEAERRSYARLFLETGSFPAFAPARAFYERHGFAYRGPFGDYVDDPNSVFMSRRL